MKKIAIRILICMILMIAPLSIAESVENINSKQMSNELQTASGSDVPVWEVGDIWTYEINDINIDFEKDGKSMHVLAKIGDVTLEVIDILNDFYNLEFKTKVNGNYEVDISSTSIKIAGNIIDATVNGNIFFRKSDLAIDRITAYISGSLTAKFLELPYVPFSIPTIQTSLEMRLAANFDTPCTLLNFPISTSKVWGLSSTNILVDGEIRSPLFDKLDSINKMAGWLGIELIPSELSRFLPVIDVGDVLDEYGAGKAITIPTLENACVSEDTISVGAGIYDAFNISIGSGLNNYYYAPEAKNIIKMSVDLKEVLPYIGNIDIELIETNLDDKLAHVQTNFERGKLYSSYELFRNNVLRLLKKYLEM